MKTVQLCINNVNNPKEYFWVTAKVQKFFECNGLKLAIHRPFSKLGFFAPDFWDVTDVETGLAVDWGHKTVVKAQVAAENRLNWHRYNIKKAIAQALEKREKMVEISNPYAAIV